MDTTISGENCSRFDSELNERISELAVSVEMFKRYGAQRIILIGQSPEFSFDPKACIRMSSWQRLFSSPALREMCKANHFDFAFQRSGILNFALSKFAKQEPSVIFINPFDRLCRGGQCMVLNSDEKLLYADSVHLTPVALEIIEKDLLPDLVGILR
jgi:hypothetical protein